ncbi:hypothetical protein FB451DRAFT_1564329 [Mycena latifolia]|nr:hypothetical protein FB451DRAFT_1564329 [Mycena latifolia]
MEVDGKKGGKQSRFSTLRVFKFSKNPPPGPPPLPPKDPVYLAARNRSLASLSPDSIPGSPLSPDQYAASTSAVSLALPQAAPKQRSGLFKFATVSKKSAESSPVQTEEDDENISMPWNFQHHVHVDEGFAGLPPSWTTSLQEAGFSDDEIAAIQQRRLADRPRDRPHSPAVVRPVPRSTSLPKSQHTPASSLSASSASASSTNSSPVPVLPRERTELLKTEAREYSPKLPSPKSPPPGYWRDELPQPQPLNLRRREQSPQPSRQPSPQHSRQSSRQHSPPLRQQSPPSRQQSPPSQQQSPSPSRTPSRSPSPSPPASPEPERRPILNAKNLTLDLALEDPAGSWSDAVLSATPWSASANSPLFTLTAPPATDSPDHQGPALSEVGSPTLGDSAYSPTAAYYSLTPSPTRATHLPYDDEDPDNAYLGLGTPSPTSSAFAHAGGLEPAARDNRDSGMSDSTMLGVPPSAGDVHQVSIARRAVANVVAATVSNTSLSGSTNGAPARMPPASPQSSHFGSSGSSESQDHQTPTTELADGDAEGLDYYVEGKNYLETNGYHLDVGHKQRYNSEDAEEERRRREWEDMQKRRPSPKVEATSQKQTKADAPPRKQPDPRAHKMVSATDTFGGPVDPDSPGEDEYEYGYEFPPEDDGSAFGSPHDALGGASPRRSPRDEEAEQEDEGEEDEEGTLGPKERAALGLASGDVPATRPTVITTRAPARAQLSPGPLTALGLAQTPVTPAHRYAGWVAATVAPLEDFIDEPVDPRDFYCDLQEIAEGESGSLPPLVHARDVDDVENGRRALVAIKSVALLPGGSQKLTDVQRECRLLHGLLDALWIRMELMERSLADVVGLVDEGLRLQEPRIIARFASDMLLALDYLQRHNIAHRDLRSDNLLLNSEGVLKLTDFSNAVLAPEVRSGAYDPLKIDVWSVGATVWEIAEATPPFSDTQQPAECWPPVTEPALYPPAFHDFLRQCSEPAASRPTPKALLQTPFLQKACGRPVIVQLLSRCMAIEQALQAGGAPPDSPP